MKRLSIAVSLGLLIWAFGGCSRSSGPTSPTLPPVPPAPPASPSVTYTLSGVISEEVPTGRAPVEGAQVRESRRGLVAMTDQNGFYRMPGVTEGASVITVSKESYEPSSRSVTINGDTLLDIQLVRRVTYALFGIVFEESATGQVPVEGAWVAESSEFHAGVWTDQDGFYRFSTLYAGGNTVAVIKDGYHTVRKDVTINGDTRLDMKLVRR